ncbi:MAG: hypothetical protein KJ056_03970 [Acidimicrobiia bacterium]|nr:hypothetical protein [Acidimicrobiia bacterium]
MGTAALAFVDDDGHRVELDAPEAESLMALAGSLDAATVSACPDCRSRVVAVVALVDLLEAAPPLPSSVSLVELADDAPTLHVYVMDRERRCSHPRWRDPGFEEWADVVAEQERESPPRR